MSNNNILNYIYTAKTHNMASYGSLDSEGMIGTGDVGEESLSASIMTSAIASPASLEGNIAYPKLERKPRRTTKSSTRKIPKPIKEEENKSNWLGTVGIILTIVVFFTAMGLTLYFRQKYDEKQAEEEEDKKHDKKRHSKKTS